MKSFFLFNCNWPARKKSCPYERLRKSSSERDRAKVIAPLVRRVTESLIGGAFLSGWPVTFNLISILFLITSTFQTSAKADVILTMGGDLNLGQSKVAPMSDRACKNGQCFSWVNVFKDLEPLLIGNLNFYNMETVLTDGEEQLSAKGGKYLFRTHLEGVRYAKKIGLNWMSLANNHVGDYGTEGMLETLESLERLSKEGGPLLYHGIARSKNEILQPSVIEINSTTEGPVRIAFAAVTFVRNSSMQVDQRRPGVLYPENTQDMNELLRNFRNISADFKVLSIHGGTERQLTLNPGQQDLYESFLSRGELDLIIGHHPHRVRPVEKVGHKVIFYSLGNYLMLGASGLNDHSDAEDFGLMGRLYLSKNSTGRLEIKSIEAIPLFNMHARVFPLTGKESKNRLEKLNDLTNRQLGNAGIQWSYLPNGWGQFCFAGCQTDVYNP